jgi:hypothetical protein
MPSLPSIAAGLGGEVQVLDVPVPHDCVDGFVEAFYGRPEQLLDPAVRGAQSSWGFVASDVADRGVAALAADVAGGSWDRRYTAASGTSRITSVRCASWFR